MLLISCINKFYQLNLMYHFAADVVFDKIDSTKIKVRAIELRSGPLHIQSTLTGM